MPSLPPFANEPVLELRRAPVRAQLEDALGLLDRTLPLHVPVMVGSGERLREDLHSTDPGDPDSVVAVAACATPSDVAAAVAEAERGASSWRAVPAEERAAALIRAAAWLRERRLEIAALEVRECAKPWPEADADVCEAIDFLEYYARGAIELDTGPPLLQVPGEHNELRYVPRGVTAVISPWNFPIAIPCGMTSAALATGNAVVLKPAEQSPGCALMLVQALRAGGVPRLGALAAARGGRRRRRARAPSGRAHDRVHRLAAGRARDRPRRRRGRARPEALQARGVGARRQELRDRRCRRRPRRGGAGDRVLGVRLRRPEVLGGIAGARPRGDRRSADRAARRARPACSSSGRPSSSGRRCRR